MTTSYLIVADELKRHGKLEEAIDIYRQNILKNPNSSWAHYLLGETLEKLGLLDEAVSAYSKSIELNPTSDSFHYKLGVALAKQGKVNDAVLSIEKAFSIRPLPLYREKITKINRSHNVNVISKEKVKNHQSISESLQNEDINDQDFLTKYSSLEDDVFIHRVYREYLQCQATTQELVNYKQQLSDGKMTRLEVILSIRQSPEFIKNNCQQIEIVSAHIEKTAGTLFGDLLHKVYGSNKVYRDYPNTPLSYRGKMNSKIKVIHGHIPAHKYQNIIPSAKLITWLRHPVKLIISLYYYWLNNPVGIKHIKALVKGKDVNINNFVENYTNIISNKTLSQTNLEDFYFIGIQEYLQEDIEELAKMLGWHGVNIESLKKNENPYPDYKIERDKLIDDRDWFNHVVSLNDLDMQIYNTALEMREKRRKS